MIRWFLKKVLGSKNQRELRRIQPILSKCNEIERRLRLCSEDTLREKTAVWKKHFSSIKSLKDLENGLESILPEAFAIVKNAAHRLCGRSFTVCDQLVTWNMVHFDVQLLGGIVLHYGQVAEM